eukprot:CAMPEP_0181035664 /NCGR_PEP_ID=MMETSP1070-20121207/8442_1 /TAXON_ID=265543 /ORGANISM="Minutocellus polymorphus, Strain NH13" /LENGTH=371 /DNA_ID=CAMNT_0023113235 /DNA_START=151 /DNA_END=1266 /DNA_ORIENTATION=+
MIRGTGRKDAKRDTEKKNVRILLLVLAAIPIIVVSQLYGNLEFNDDTSTPSSVGSTTVATAAAWDPKLNPLSIPPGKAQNFPSPRLQDSSAVDKKRKGYGGAGDEQHLGGFGEIDPGGINPGLFKYMITDLGVKTFLDIGCGRGFSTSWFHFHGCDVFCAEGSHDAWERSVLPDKEHQMVLHDFSRGPWWPEKTYDVAWSVEFLEHVNVNYHYNYVTAFRKAALIFVTASKGHGWHHVEVHSNEWWIRKYESYGFKYDAELTEKAKAIARSTKKDYKGPHGQYLDGFYVRVTLMVFVNPVVAALPEHAHLFPEIGCFESREENGLIIHRKCDPANGESEPDPNMYPLELSDQMDEDWLEWLRPRVAPPKSF